jgi:hypothetical protein
MALTQEQQWTQEYQNLLLSKQDAVNRFNLLVLINSPRRAQ